VLNTEGRVVGVSVATFRGGQNLNFAIPVSYLRFLLADMKSPKPLSTEATPNKKPSILSTVGGKNTQAILVTHLKIETYGFEYSFSFRNMLREPVTDIVCLVVFYDDQRDPIDTSIVVFRETIPPGLARRSADNRMESSVYGIIKGKREKKQDLSEKFASCMEFRILDFKIVE